MYKVPEQITSANAASVEALAVLAKTAFASAERMAALNLNTVRMLLEDSVANTRALLAVKDVQELVSLQTTLAQPGLKKASAYSRRAYDIASDTQEAFSKVAKAQVSKVNQQLSLALVKAGETAPAGSDVAINALRSALAAANSVYDRMAEASKRLAELAEANFAAATVVKSHRKAA